MYHFPEMNLRILKVLGDFIESFQDLPNYIFIAPLFLGLGGWRHLSMKNEMGSWRIRCQSVSGRAHTLRQEHEPASHMLRQWVCPTEAVWLQFKWARHWPGASIVSCRNHLYSGRPGKCQRIMKHAHAGNLCRAHVLSTWTPEPHVLSFPTQWIEA